MNSKYAFEKPLAIPREMLSLPDLINVVIAISVLLLESIARVLAHCVRFFLPEALTRSALRLALTWVPLKDGQGQDPLLDMDCARLVRYRGFVKT